MTTSASRQPLPQVFYDTASSTSSGERNNASKLTRSRSLESSRTNARLRSRSVDCAERDLGDEDRSSPDDLGTDDALGNRYVALADYVALTTREIDLREDEVVELVKVGCAGWWYVRLSSYPFPEGWAPSTYLEKLPEH